MRDLMYASIVVVVAAASWPIGAAPRPGRERNYS